MNGERANLEQEQAQRLAELGDRLRLAREERDLTVDQIATLTLIQPRLIRAIEAGKLQQLPEPVYIQGFIKRYANALGMDGTAVSKEFPTELDPRAVQPSWKDSPAAQLRPVHLYTAYIALIVVAISGLSYLMSRTAPWAVGLEPSPSPEAVASPTEPSAPSPGTSPSPTAIAPEASPSPAVPAKPVRVQVTLTAQSWLRVDIDGETEFQGILPEGTQRSWTAESQLTLRAGNAGAVILAYNEGEAKPMGEPGTVREITFPEEQQAASRPTP